MICSRVRHPPPPDHIGEETKQNKSSPLSEQEMMGTKNRTHAGRRANPLTPCRCRERDRKKHPAEKKREIDHSSRPPQRGQEKKDVSQCPRPSLRYVKCEGEETVLQHETRLGDGREKQQTTEEHKYNGQSSGVLIRLLPPTLVPRHMKIMDKHGQVVGAHHLVTGANGGLQRRKKDGSLSPQDGS